MLCLSFLVLMKSSEIINLIDRIKKTTRNRMKDEEA